MGPCGVGSGGAEGAQPPLAVCLQKSSSAEGKVAHAGGPSVPQVHDYYALYHFVAMVNLSVFPTRL